MAKPVTRISLPFLDLVTIRTPDAIRKANASQDLERLQHSHPNPDTLPFPFNLYFPKTRFLSTSHGYFLPMTPNSNPTYSPCLAFLNSKLNETPVDISHYIKRAADLLEQPSQLHNDTQLAKVLADALFSHFHGDVPQQIIEHAQHQLSSPLALLNPFNLSAERHLTHVYDYVQKSLTDSNLLTNLPNRVTTDVAQTILAPAQVGPRLLRAIHKNLDQSVERTFSDLALTERVIRVAKRAGNLHGLLETPLVPGKTIVILDIGEAATQTGQYEWVFSAGAGRRCSAERVLVSFCNALRTELLERRDRKH